MDLLIIGSGPAGLTAGIYAARARLNPVIITGWEEGGLIVNGTDIENYPGFPKGISTAQLVQNFKEQGERFGCQLVKDVVEKVDLTERPYLVKTKDREYYPRALIIATGASPRRLALEKEAQFVGKGISYCATCDGFFYQKQDVAIVGGGDSALEEALFLTRFAKKVYLIHRRDALRGSKILQEQVFGHEKIQIIWDTVIRDILPGADNRLLGLLLYNGKREETSTLKVRGLFVAIGYVPNSHLFSPYLKLDDQGYIITNKRYHTSKEGVFAAGDVQDPNYRQVVTACGSGAAAALEGEKFLMHGDRN